MASSEIIQFLLRVRDEASAALGSVKKEAGGAAEATDKASEASKRASVNIKAVGTAAATGAASLAAVAAAAFKAADAASALVDKYAIAAAQTGMTAQQVVGLDKAARAAGLNGVADLQTGLASLTRTVSAAQGGSEEAADRLRALGISAESMDLARPADMLRQVADGMAALPSEGQKASAAIDLFGARGARLVTVLGQGSGALDEWTSKAERAGLVMSGEALAASAQMDAAMADLNIAVEAVTLQVGTALIPVFRAAADVLVEWTPLIVAVARILADDFTRGAYFAIQVLVEFGKVAVDRFGVVVDAVRSVGSAMGSLDEAFAALVRGDLTTAGQAFGRMTDAAGEARERFADLASMAANPIRNFDDMAAAVDRAVDSTRTFEVARQEMRDTATEAGALASSLAGGPDSIEGAAGDAAKAVTSLAEVMAATDIGSLGRVTPAGDQGALNVGLGNQRAAMGQAEQARGAAAMAVTFADARGFAGLLGQTISGNLSAALQAVAEPLGTAIGGPVGAIVGGAVAGLSRSLIQIGQQGPEAIAAGLSEQFSALLDGILALPEAIVLGVLGIVEQLGSIGERLGTFLATKLDDLLVGLVIQLPAGILRGIFQIPVQFLKALGQWWANIGGFVGLAKSFAQGIGDWFRNVWADIKAFFKKVFTLGLGGEDGAVAKVKGFFKDVGEFLKTGDTGRDHYPKGGFVTRDGLAFVERGERIVRTTGQDSQTGSAMGTERGGGGVVVNISNSLVDQSVLDRLVRELERQYGSNGRRSSDLFAIG